MNLDPDRVIIMAGPSCVGKTTIMGRLERRQCRELALALGLTEPQNWAFCNARRLPPSGVDGAAPRRLVLHYDISRPRRERSIESFERDPALASAVAAPNLCICSVWGTAELLRERASLKFAAHLRVDAKSLRTPVTWCVRTIRLRALRRRYRDACFVREQFEGWFAFVQTLPNVNQHVVVDARDAEPRAVPFSHWRSSASNRI